MRRSAVSLLLVLFVIDIFGAVIEQRGELSGPISSRDGDAVALDGQGNREQDANLPQLGSNEIDENAVDVNSPLLSDENDHAHPHHSTAEKHKRCPSYRVGAALKSRSGIVGAESPPSLERRDLQSQFYGRMCTTCMSRHSCNVVSECPLCEKWCTKVADNDESPTDGPKEQQGPIVSPNLDEPIVSMASRSNFGDDNNNRKNVYTIATLRSGNEKETILRVLGVSGAEDIDSVVVLATTHSNNPPFLPNGFQAAPVQDAERFVDDIRNQQQIIPTPIVGEPNPASSQTLNSEVPVRTDILPRYPIDSNPNGFIVHQSLNPDIIEGPPSMIANAMDGEKIAGTLLGSPIKEQETMPYQDTPTDFLPSLREDNQPGLLSIDGSRMSQIIPPNQPFESNIRLPMEAKDVLPSATIDKLLAGSNQLTPGARMREFLENVKANRDNAKNSILSRKITGINNGSPAQNQIEPITSNLQSRAKEAMDKFKSIQIPTSFQRFNDPDENINIVQSDHIDPNEISKFSEDASRIHHGHNIPHGHSHGHGHHFRTSEQEDNKLMNSQTNEAVNPEMNLEATNDFTGDGSNDDISNSQPRTPHGKGHGHSHGHGHGHGHHHRTSEQGEFTDPQEATNDMMMTPNNGQGFTTLDGRNGMGTLGSQNIDPKRIMEFSEDEGSFNPQSRSYQRHDAPNGPHHASEQTIEEEAVTEGTMSSTDEKSLNQNHQSSFVEESPTRLGATEDKMTGMGNPIQPEQIQITPVGSLEPNPVVDAQPSVSKKADGVGIVKMKLGTRTNELLQKIREKQDAMKQSLLGSKKTLNAASEVADPKTPVINNFDKADAGLGAVQDITDEIQQGKGSQQATRTTDTVPDVPEFTSDKIAPETERFPQMVGQSEVVGSQPLEDSFERIQPFMSRSGRPWHNHISNLDAARDKEPSLGSTNLDQLANPRVMKDGEAFNQESRGQFEETPASNSLGAIIPGQKEMEISFQKPSDIYFIGNGIKLPLQMMKKADGAVHFSVDMEKLCSCNNASCPKNHTDIEKTVETILEKEAELKDQLVHTAQDFVNKPISDIDTRKQPTLGQQFENMSPPELNSQQDKIDDMPPMQVPQNMIRPTSFHRDQRDIARKFLEMKNRIASNNDSTELQSDGADILKRSLVEETNSTETQTQDIGRSTIKPVPQKESKGITNTKPQRKSVENTSKLATHNIKKDQNTNKYIPNVTKETVAQTTASSFQNFLGKRLDEFKSRMSELEKRNQAISKDLGFPPNLLGNIWKDAAIGTTENSNRLSTVNSTPQNLGSRIQDIFNKSVKKDLELYDDLASITKPYKFKNLEKKMENTINQYTKIDDKIVKDESATLQSMLTEDPVIKREVGIASNILKFFKDLASEKGK